MRHNGTPLNGSGGAHLAVNDERDDDVFLVGLEHDVTDGETRCRDGLQ